MMTEVKPNQPPHRPIRSYVLREGRMTKGQQRAMEELWPVYGLSLAQGAPIDFDMVFGRQAPLTLEIGFGDGGALLEMAIRHPERDFVGIEVHRPGVGSLMLRLEQEALTNVRLFCEDGVGVLRKGFAKDALDRVQLFFPDPWHKKRHHKRRILNAAFIDLIVGRLKDGGVFHFATDWQPYAEEALSRLEQCNDLENIAGQQHYSPRPASRPETKFERRGQRLGHGVWDILMRKQ